MTESPRKRGRPPQFEDPAELDKHKKQQKREYRQRNLEHIRQRDQAYSKRPDVLARRRQKYKANKDTHLREKSLDIVMNAMRKIAEDNKDIAWSFAQLDRDTVRNYIDVT